MDHITDLQLADLADGLQSRENEATLQQHLWSCQRCWEACLFLHQSLRVPFRIALYRSPDDIGSKAQPLAAEDAAKIDPLSSADGSIRIRFRRARPHGPLRAYLVAGEAILPSGPRLILSSHPDGFVFRTDGTTDLPGVDPKDLHEAALLIPLLRSETDQP